MVVLIVIGAIVLISSNLEVIVEQGLWSLAALAVWVLWGAIIIGIVDRLQSVEGRSRWAILGALAWGGLAATAYAQVGNTAFEELILKVAGADVSDRFGSSISAPLVEESLKTAGIVALALIPGARLRTPLDGLFYGVLVGAGFQVVEDFFYTVSSMAGSGDDLGALIQTFVLRGLLLGLFSHAVYSGIIGAGIGYAVSRTWLPAWRRVLPAVGAFVLVIVFHGVFDLDLQHLGIAIVISVVPLLVLLVVLWWARRDAQAATFG
jgi:RsiW-degrading membrane proteinase PrsW (M82 family)